jgi:ribosomal protein S18 acetylase RimI-like enzyme
MKIREAKISDAEKIHRLGMNIKEFAVSDETVVFWPLHILKNCIRSKSDWIIVAENKNEILGFIIINNSIVFKKAIIENIFVAVGYRNKGVAKKLLVFALNKIKLSGCEYVCTLAEERNEKAWGFYIKNGFYKGKNFRWLDKTLSKKFKKS